MVDDSDREPMLKQHLANPKRFNPTFPLPKKIREWLSHQAPMKTFWIVGGGERVQELRQISGTGHFAGAAQEELHWQCIKIMNTNSMLFNAWLPKWSRVDKFCDSVFQSGESNESAADDKRPNSENLICLIADWLKSNPDLLPKSWDVTSDSIAATFAAEFGASELVLLKSCDADGTSIQSLSDSGYVDKHFPIAVANCQSHMACRFVNFQHPSFEETCLFSRQNG